MNYSRISVRYAKALFQASSEKNILDEVYKDILLIQTMFNEIAQLKFVMESPVIQTSVKAGLIYSIYSGKVNDLTMKFLELIVKNKRELHLKHITRNFIENYKDFKGIKTVTLTTAFVIDEETKTNFVDKIKKYLNKTIELHETVNPEIIGGFILKIDDLLFDSSVTTKLAQIKRKLVSN